MKSHPIPPERGYRDRASEPQANIDAALRDILEKASVDDPGRSPGWQKIGDFYASCMDLATLEARGASPLKAELARIDKLTSKSDLAMGIGRLHLIGAGHPGARGGGGLLFDLGPTLILQPPFFVEGEMRP